MIFDALTETLKFDFFKALYTLFQVLTGESWSEAIARPLLEWSPWATAVYFVSFILINGVVLINVVVAVLLEKMVDDEPEEEEEEDETPGAAPHAHEHHDHHHKHPSVAEIYKERKEERKARRKAPSVFAVQREQEERAAEERRAADRRAAELAAEMVREGEGHAAMFRHLAPLTAAVLGVMALAPILFLIFTPLLAMGAL